MASVCPVPPALTCSQVGLAILPAVYPDSAPSTPGSFSKSASMHQKQPPAKIAVAVTIAVSVGFVDGAPAAKLMLLSNSEMVAI